MGPVGLEPAHLLLEDQRVNHSAIREKGNSLFPEIFRTKFF